MFPNRKRRLHAAQPWVENSIQHKAEHGKGKSCQHEQKGWFQDPVILTLKQGAVSESICNHLTPGRQDRISQPENRERCLSKYIRRNQRNQLWDEKGNNARNEVEQYDAHVGSAVGAGCVDVRRLFHLQKDSTVGDDRATENS